MYKKFPLFGIVLLTMAIILSACGSSVKNSAEDNKPKSEEIIKKSEEFAKNIKSVDFHSELSQEYLSQKNSKLEQKVDGSSIVEPLAAKYSYTYFNTYRNKETKGDIVVKDNTLYIDKNKTESNSDLYSPKYQEIAKNISYNTDIYYFLNKYANDFSVSEENDNYVLTYNKTTDDTASISEIKKTIAYMMGLSYSIDSSDTYKTNIRFVVTKKFEPIEINISITDYSIETDRDRFTQTLKNTYSNFNKVEDIQIPNN